MRYTKFKLRRFIEDWLIAAKNLQTYVPLLQLIVTIIGLWSIWFALKSYSQERERFEMDYGSQIELNFERATLIATPRNDRVQNINLDVRAFLELSDESYKRERSQFIEVLELFSYTAYLDELPESYFVPSITDYSNRYGVPIPSRYLIDRKQMRFKSKYLSIQDQLDQFVHVFNISPTKLYPSLLCVAYVEYTDAQQRFRKDFFLMPNCIGNIEPVAEEQYLERIPESLVIGEIDFSRTNRLGFASAYFVNRMTNLLSRYRWKVHFREPPGMYWYRTQYQDDILRWRHDSAVKSGDESVSK